MDFCMGIHVCPASRSFKCDYGICIPQRMVCDGTYNCLDATDEVVCARKPCPADRPFKCLSGLCISMNQVYLPTCGAPLSLLPLLCTVRWGNVNLVLPFCCHSDLKQTTVLPGSKSPPGTQPGDPPMLNLPLWFSMLNLCPLLVQFS